MSHEYKGWELVFSSEINGNFNSSTHSSHSRRPNRRSKSTTSDPLILRRKHDQFQVKSGDTILVTAEDESNIALIKDIRFGINDFVEIIVVWFSERSEIETIPADIEIIEGEILLVPYLDEIELDQIGDHVHVLSENEFKKSKASHKEDGTHTFMCRRATNEQDKFSEKFDYNELMRIFAEDADHFQDTLKRIVFNSGPLKKPEAENRGKRERRGETNKKRHISVKTEEQTRKQSPTGDTTNKVDAPETANETVPATAPIAHKEPESTASSSEDIDNSESYEESEDEEETTKKRHRVATTPKKRRLGSSFKSSKSSSPKKSIRSIDSEIESIYSVVTPRKRIRVMQDQGQLPSFTSPSKKLPEGTLDPTSEAFKEVKEKLHTSQRLNALPGREDEFSMIYASLESAINERTGCCIYVSGVPGMGKTATIKDVINQMTDLAKEGYVKPFNFFEFNGLKLLAPTVAYSMLWEYITGGDRVVDSNAAILLEEYFKRNDEKRLPLVVMMDELDQIAQKKQNVMYNFFNWPTYATSKLIVIAVANTMDLPERVLANKISSRMGLRRIQFKGYTYQQLGVIIQHRLNMLTKGSRHKVEISFDAIGFASRKVASVSGDARRALTICRRAVEIAEKQYMESNDQKETCQVLISHISQAISESVNSPLAKYLNALPFAAKLFLAALLRRTRRSGLAENSVGDIIDEMKNSIAMFTTSNPFMTDSSMFDLLYADKIGDKEQINIRIHHFEFILNSLVEAGVINQQNFSSERKRMVLLTVSEEEVVSVLKKDQEISQFL
ncbi:ATPase associated with various cellular activities (AAA) family protein [Candida parapsilosis]|uniref:Origin recognition complex subunit 1 n=1 Tax=Candida parapsilosis TaxID=5480 RepID=A0A8X7NNY0_CANPA|nr:ATPase associated with various cellular activities (AAA) family protein [Candida parapsilosis]KAF6049069.1 ATPase associated with various cellular activities (AAA) family protein [Candida parapsilosis]KAF6056920.1 ATPase associated with various cellular activities (AAA) family protein [Candida parapsilosis]KAF6066361.1 ATPase associated with various cellular activities (AAA) family protein [Candida parapsilosis]KAI5902731.1 Origin recognition complex subunit 1 [Candida parapsilosis]